MTESLNAAEWNRDAIYDVCMTASQIWIRRFHFLLFIALLFMDLFRYSEPVSEVSEVSLYLRLIAIPFREEQSFAFQLVVRENERWNER